MQRLPLQDLKIIDLSSVLAGPMTANMFSELGAEVLRIENVKPKEIPRGLGYERENTTTSTYPHTMHR